MPLNSFLKSNFLTEAFKRISSLEFFELCWRELVQEFVNTKVPTTNSDLYLILLDTDVDFLGAELIYACAFSHKHDFELVTIWIVVDEFSHFQVDRIIFDRHIDGHPDLQIDYVTLKSLIFEFKISDLLQ